MTLTETMPPEVAAVRQQFEGRRTTQMHKEPLPTFQCKPLAKGLELSSEPERS